MFGQHMQLGFLQHLRIYLQTAAFRKEVECGAIVQIVMKFAVRANAWKSPPVEQLPFPKTAQAPVGDIFVAADQANQLSCRTETIPKHGCKNVENPICNLAAASLWVFASRARLISG